MVQFYREYAIEATGAFPDQLRFNTIPKIEAEEWLIIKIRMNTAKIIKVKKFDKVANV